MKAKFVVAGFDIRVWPPARYATVDATEWYQDEALYAQALKIVSENSLQLLEPDNEDSFNGLAGLVRPDAALIAIELLDSTLAELSPPIAPLAVSMEHRWETLGIDACDLNGFFSALNMKVASEDVMPPFADDETLAAFALAEKANVKIPAHRPFVLARIKRLIKY